MKKKMLTAAMISGHVLLGYSLVKHIRSINRFKETISKIDFPSVRKGVNHLTDMVETRNAQ